MHTLIQMFPKGFQCGGQGSLETVEGGVGGGVVNPLRGNSHMYGIC